MPFEQSPAARILETYDCELVAGAKPLVHRGSNTEVKEERKARRDDQKQIPDKNNRSGLHIVILSKE